jgi:hypothetical protein
LDKLNESIRTLGERVERAKEKDVEELLEEMKGFFLTVQGTC